MTSSVRYSTTTALPFWREKKLKNYCEKINQQGGQRTKRYSEVLNLVYQSITPPLQTTQVKKIYENFKLIYQTLPDDLKQKKSIRSVVAKIYTLYCSQVKTTLEKIKTELESSNDLARFCVLSKELSLIAQSAPASLKIEYADTIDKCDKLYQRRYPLVRFASQHQPQLKPLPERDVIDFESEKSRQIVPVLSIDGGGIRGIIPATMLVEIEKITREPISKLFKLIGGTSTGGILTLGLTKPHHDGSGRPQYTAQDLLNVYTQDHSQIFQKNPGYAPHPEEISLFSKIRWAIDHPKYLSPLPFYNARLGRSRLSSALTDVVVTANGLDEVASKVTSVGLSGASILFAFISGALGNRNPSFWSHDSFPKSVHYFTNGGLKTVSYSLKSLEDAYEHRIVTEYQENKPENSYTVCSNLAYDFPMTLAAQATSAAPTFFPPVSLDHCTLLDGGVLQNNPAIPCVIESFEQGYDRDDLFMVSLGTGQLKQSYKNRSSDLASSMLSNWFHLTQPDFRTELVLGNMLSFGAYHRFQYYFEETPPDLDDNKPETITLLEEKGKELVEESQDKLRDICKILKPDNF